MVRLAAICVVLLVFSHSAHALRLDYQGCVQMAVWYGDTIWARHVGADKQKVLDYYKAQPEPLFKLLVADFDTIWQMPYENRLPLIEGVYKSCVQRKGVYHLPMEA